MKRKMITGERVMYVDAETPLNCVFTVKIRGRFSPERLNHALLKVQKKHPFLNAVIKDMLKVPHLVFSDTVTPIPVRVVERHADEDWKTESEIEWAKLFDQPDAPLARIVWLKGTTVSELLLVCPHCICDGKSMVTLMAELLQVLDDPEHELVDYLPFYSLESLLGQRDTLSGKWKMKALSLLVSCLFLFKKKAQATSSGKSYMMHRKLDAETVMALKAACKREQTTVQAMLCTVYLESFLQVRGEVAHGQAVIPVDIRRFVPEIKDDMMFAMAPTIEIAIEKPGSYSFWEKARAFKEAMNAKIAVLDGRGSLLSGEYFSADQIVAYLKSAAGTHDVTISNMGILGIAENYSSFEVETIYSPSVAFPWRNPTTLIVSTFKGEMDLTFCSNEAFLDREEAQVINSYAVDLLVQQKDYAGVC